MKKFLAIYLGAKSSPNMLKWQSLDEKTKKEREKAGMEAWMRWGTKYKHAIIEEGSPLGKTKRIDKNGVTDVTNLLAAYTVVEAESYEAAAQMFVDHPHFTIFPGDSVEIMECLPIPKR